MNNRTKNVNFENKLRTAFSVFITPTLLSIVLFFAISFFNDQKDVKIQQTQILIELGKVNTQLRANETQISGNSNRIESDKKYIVSKVEINQSEILSIWKSIK